MDKSSYDLVFIGSGPGGYVGAIRAAQLGLRTAVVERAELGGVCLNWGCIPTKALLRSAEVVELMRRGEEFGVTATDYHVDFERIIQRSRDVAKRVSMGVGYLFKKNKIKVITGTGRFLAPGEIGVFDDNGAEVSRLEAKHTIVATGGRARSIPGIDIDKQKVIDYHQAMTLKTRPASMIVMGAGAIGMEFAYFYSVLGTEVTVVEMLEHVLPIEDVEISKTLERSYKKRKIKLLLKHTVAGLTHTETGVEVAVTDKKGVEKTIQGDVALMAIGVRGNVENLGLEEIGVTVDRSFIKVDETYKTSAESVYAVGDVIGPPLLAHVASHEGIACVERIAGLDPTPINYDAIPGCTFCHPQVGSIGYSEVKAKEAGFDVKVGKFPFMGVGKAVAAGEREGLVKLIFEAKEGRLLGGHIVGPEAAELLGELEAAAAAGMTYKQLGHAMHSHPTLHEAIMEAALDAGQGAIHI